MGETRRGLTGWAAATVLVSAFLLFQVQPMVSKMILPWFGGGPSVWTTCMLFFQVFLLAGYAYAHALEQLPRTRVAGMIHLVLLVAALAVLPILPGETWKPHDSSQPQWRIVTLLAANVGLPYFLLAASAPLVQAWYSRAFHGRSPYRFYALSNVGSLTALLSYPFVIEPAFDIPHQSTLWSCCFAAFAVLSGGLALVMTRWNLPAAHTVTAAHPDTAADALSLVRLGLWLLLPAFGSMSLLAVTNQICQDVAVVPFLWILPLSLYLVTFIICFDAERWYLRTVTSLATLLVVFLIAAMLVPERVQPVLGWFGISRDLPEFIDSLALEAGAYLAALFLICMLCHGELVRIRPGSRHLTLFYLMIAAGGALGGLFVALVCPRIFTSFVESDICLIGGAVLAAVILLQAWWCRERRWASWWIAGTCLPWMIAHDLLLLLVKRGDETGTRVRHQRIFQALHVVRRRRKWWTLWSVLLPVPAFALLLLVALLPGHRNRPNVIVAKRNFYGALSVSEYGGADSENQRRNLYNGRILHGVQFRQPDKRDIATTYYTAASGVGLTLANIGGPEPLRVATVGLGTGTIAAYGQPGDYYCFYEINPQVIDIAQQYFTYLSDCPAEVHIELGDARLSMEQQPPQSYDVIALDAFSGDAIPAHLLTVEAFAVYRRHLKPAGVIAVHTSNRHLNLRPIVALIAQHYSMQVVAVYAEDEEGVADSASDWLLVTNNEEFLHCKDIAQAGKPLDPPDAAMRVWTDQYSNLFQILTVWQKWKSWWYRQDAAADAKD
ncbi:MAG: spermidine synthase [Pirellulaceae bacterium]